MHELLELAQDQGSLQSAHTLIASGESPPESVRKVIRRSWARSVAAGVSTVANAPATVDSGIPESRLLSASSPILEHYSASLAGTNFGILLGDRNSRLIGRWAADVAALRRLDRVGIYRGLELREDVRGTNGIGTVVEELLPVAIVGAEHYADALADHVCVGAPIRHPLTQRFEGVLAISGRLSETTALLLPTVIELAERIGSELAATAAVSERVVFERFIARCSRTPRSVVAVTDRYMLTNALAAEWIDVSQRALLWEQLASSFSRSQSGDRALTFSDGTALGARCASIRYGSKVIGAIVEFDAATPVRTRPTVNTKRGATVVLGRERAGSGSPTCSAETSEFVVVTGPIGSGRRSAARDVLRVARPTGPAPLLHPAGLVLSWGPQRWLAELDSFLADPDLSAIVSDVDLLDDATTHGLIAVLQRYATPGGSTPRVVMTSSPGERADSLMLRTDAPRIAIAPLAERRNEIPALCRNILRDSGRAVGIGHHAMSALINHNWRGEIAELKAVLLQAADSTAGRTISYADLKSMRDAPSASAVTGVRVLTSLEQAERCAIISAMNGCHGNKLRAANELGISRSTLYKKLRKHHLEDRRQLI